MEFKLPDRLTFKRTEVIKLTKLDGRVIDYWEREFGGLKPVVNKMGETFYTRQDVELILKIKHLMIEKKMEKSEVKKIIGENNGNNTETAVVERKTAAKPNDDTLKIIRSGLQEILTLLSKDGKT